MKTLINALAVAALVISAPVLTGCSRSVPWANNETRFEFGGLPSKKAPALKARLQSMGYRVRDAGGDVVTFDVTGIENTRQLGQVLNEVAIFSEEENVSLPLETAVLTFGQLELEGALTTTVTVRVSSRARAFVADGPDKRRAWREVTPRNGVWTGPVSTSGVVAESGGWVYILAVRDRDRRYQRINVLTKKLETDIAKPDFPDPSGTGEGNAIERIFDNRR